MTWQLVVYSAGAYSPDVHKLVCTPCSHLHSRKTSGGQELCLSAAAMPLEGMMDLSLYNSCHCHHCWEASTGTEGAWLT